MDYPQFDYAIIGGDMRQTYLVQELAHHQNRITHYALLSPPDKLECFETSYVQLSRSLKEACTRSQCIIGPIPFCKSRGAMNQQGLEDSLSTSYLLSFLHSGHCLFGGAIPEDFSQPAKEKGVRVYDLLEEKSLAQFNTIATAEGAICEAISRSPQNLHRSNCGVLGFGACGSTLVPYLRGMFCDLHVFSNDSLECAKAAIIANTSDSLTCFEKNVGIFDFVFNTIPTLIITEEILCNMKSSVTIIDIASAPGGVDYTAAKKLGIKATLCPGLPGKYAPLSSAKAIKSTMELIISREKQH